jgi:hypothetical protein
MTFALVNSLFAQYGGGDSSGGGGYSAAYWVIVALIAIAVIAAVVWLVSGFAAHRRARNAEPFGSTAHDRVATRPGA